MEKQWLLNLSKDVLGEACAYLSSSLSIEINFGNLIISDWWEVQLLSLQFNSSDQNYSVTRSSTTDL